MKCMMSSDGAHIVRVSEDEASELYHNENYKYVNEEYLLTQNSY